MLSFLSLKYWSAPAQKSRSEMTINDLPLELITQIIGHYRTDRDSLKAFSLVSRAFLSICRMYLFDRLRINSIDPSFSFRCALWSDLSTRSPEILSHLRVLELGPPIFRLRARDPLLSSDHWSAVMERGVPSIHDTRIQSIMDGAVNAHSVTLRFEFQNWHSFSPAFQRVVINLIQRESVSSLSLEDVVDFPMHALSNCRYLKHLSLIQVNDSGHLDLGQYPISYHVPGDFPVASSKGWLESLTLFASDGCVDSFVRNLSDPGSILDLTRLKRLSVNATGTDGRVALSKVPLIAQSITTLELRVSDGKGKYEQCRPVNFRKLKSLIISLPIKHGRIGRPIRDLALFVTEFRSQVVKLNIHFRREDSESGHEPKSHIVLILMCANTDWQALEQDLAVQGRFPALSQMTVVWRPRDIPELMTAGLGHYLEHILLKMMPTLSKRMQPTLQVYVDRFEDYTEGR
ncbi:hypothetical protein B0H34DRAFT_732807 [Crassisporium funariophilum]|nr:hypothetical protein B0H34DRAFT_732807 [Crassisporium funariophilum]